MRKTVALISRFSPLVCGEFAVLHVAYVPPEELPPPDPSSASPPGLILNANGVQEVHAEQAGLLVHAGDDVGVGDDENTLLHVLHFHFCHTEKTSFSFFAELLSQFEPRGGGWVFYSGEFTAQPGQRLPLD